MRGVTAAQQTRIGLSLAVAVIAAWLVLHVVGVFFWTWSPSTALLAVPVVLLQTWLSTGLFIIAHDAMHGSLAPGRPKLNHALGTLCLALYAQLSFKALLPKHFEHHRYPGSEHDPDFDANNPRRALPWLMKFFFGYYSHGQILRLTLLVLIYTFVLGAPYLNLIVFWAVPALLAVGQLFYFGTYLPHRHGDDAFADRHNARNAPFSPLVSLVTCFHFGGFHHQHHLSPGTPWWQLPRLAR